MEDNTVEKELLNSSEMIYTPGNNCVVYEKIDLVSDFDEKINHGGKTSKATGSILKAEYNNAMLVLCFLCFLASAFVMYTFIDGYGNGTQADNHKLRIRNDSSFIIQNGSDYIGFQDLPFNREDFSQVLDFTQFEEIEPENIEITLTPLGLSLTLPDSPMELQLLQPKNPTIADSGGKINILIGNPTRRRMKFEEIWFNTGYWKDRFIYRNFSMLKDKFIYAEINNRTEKLYIPSAYNIYSVTPLWEIDLYKLRRQENSIVINPNGLVFNMNPLLVRNFEGKIVMNLTQFTGILAVDAAGAYSVECNNCNVTKMLVISDFAIHLSNYSIYTTEIRRVSYLYSVVGEFDETYYQKRLEVMEEQNVSIIISSDVKMKSEQSKSKILLVGTIRDEVYGAQLFELDIQDFQCSLAQLSEDGREFKISCFCE